MVKAPPATEAPALVTPVKVRKPRSKEGAAEAKAAATMTLEEWRKLQAGMGELWPAPDYMAMPMPGRSHTNYRDETYAFITRWMAETKIAYRPHAKSPGSKSHLRYEKYAKATTVKEALELGSYPQDWCWDYERGFIKVEGPVRSEPIDIVQCTDTNALTEVDRIIYRWYNKELAKILGLDYKDLFGTSDPSILRAHRLVAQREARSRLEAAEREGRRISDEDVLSTLKQWAFIKNAARSNVIPEGQEWVWSDTLGLIRDRLGSIHSTPATKLYPEVVQVLVKWLNDRLPQEAAGFRFTSINLNCNYAARLHRDGNNFGPSFIKAFGDFTGGRLNYWPEDDKGMDLESLPEAKGVALDIGSSAEGGLALFNGNSAHSVEAFQGTRYSVVFFTLGCHDRAVQEDRDFLSSLGVSFPRPDEERYGLLRAPRGYGLRPPATPMRDTRASVMFFKNSDLEAREFVPKPLQKVEPLNPAATRQPPQEAQATPAKRAPRAAAKGKAASGGKVRKLQLKRPGPVATGAASSAPSSSAPAIIEVL
mmetsp:Transcript_116681/g.341556  ORF Transcript_116681/g.341556 Transcript_116681/m.341556 type:complete len:537 (+) Transcript_116681:84-1694(+)